MKSTQQDTAYLPKKVSALYLLNVKIRRYLLLHISFYHINLSNNVFSLLDFIDIFGSYFRFQFHLIALFEHRSVMSLVLGPVPVRYTSSSD